MQQWLHLPIDLIRNQPAPLVDYLIASFPHGAVYTDIHHVSHSCFVSNIPSSEQRRREQKQQQKQQTLQTTMAAYR